MAIPTDKLALSAKVEYKTTTDDGYGAKIVTWATRQAAFRCRIYQSRGEVVRLPGGEEAISSHKLIGECKEVHAGDRLTIGGATYTLLGPDFPGNKVMDSSQWHHVECYLRSE